MLLKGTYIELGVHSVASFGTVYVLGGGDGSRTALFGPSTFVDGCDHSSHLCPVMPTCLIDMAPAALIHQADLTVKQTRSTHGAMASDSQQVMGNTSGEDPRARPARRRRFVVPRVTPLLRSSDLRLLFPFAAAQ